VFVFIILSLLDAHTRPCYFATRDCTKCFEGLVSNILQGDKTLHFLSFVNIFILLRTLKVLNFVVSAIEMAWMEEQQGRIVDNRQGMTKWCQIWTKLRFYLVDSYTARICLKAS
jgi:hypothetical protein